MKRTILFFTLLTYVVSFSQTIDGFSESYDLRESDPILYEKPMIGDIIINELLFNSNENNEEFVEIYNKSDKILDVSGMILTTRKKDGTINKGASVSNNTFVLSNSYLALCKNPSKDSIYFHCPKKSCFSSMKSWQTLNNITSTFLICNATKDIIYDELIYSDSWHHPLVKNNKGVSLERIHPSMPTQNNNSWHSASSDVYYATPGYENSQYSELGKFNKTNECWLENESFSPNNDGFEDVLFLRYQLEENGWIVNITIFDAGGQKIKSLYKNQLLSIEGILSWDGSKDNSLIDIGLYVLYVEMFNVRKGETKRFKFPCVVNNR